MADLILRIALCFFVLKVTAIKVFSPVGRTVVFPCKYEYESKGSIKQLSVQWRGPKHELLCHYIKHKAYRNCTRGYSMDYAPGNVSLTIAKVKQEDFGTHTCSVSKRHDFSDFTVDLTLGTESSTTPPKDRGELSGYSQDHLLLFGFALIVAISGC